MPRVTVVRPYADAQRKARQLGWELQVAREDLAGMVHVRARPMTAKARHMAMTAADSQVEREGRADLSQMAIAADCLVVANDWMDAIDRCIQSVMESVIEVME